MYFVREIRNIVKVSRPCYELDIIQNICCLVFPCSYLFKSETRPKDWNAEVCICINNVTRPYLGCGDDGVTTGPN